MNVKNLSVDTIKAQRILVIAPHPDDESLGCGGLITLLAQKGREFHTVFVTDGGASHPNSLLWSRERLAKQRENEAIAALHILGAGHHPRTFLKLSDAAMPCFSSPEGNEALFKMEALIESFQPDLVLLPWRRDPHCDHRDAWVLAKAALAFLPSQPATLEYAVWLEEYGSFDDHPKKSEAESVSFDISEAIDIKRAAVMSHKSQTSDLINDDPQAFRLSLPTIERLCGAVERYWRPIE